MTSSATTEAASASANASFGGQPRRPLRDLGLRGEAVFGWGVARPHPLLVPRARVSGERRRARRRWLRRGLLRLSLPPLATAPLRASALALPLGGGRGRAGGGGRGRGGVAAVGGAAGVWPGGRRGTMAGPDGAESGRVGGVGGVGGGRSRFCRGLGDAPRQGAAEWRRGREPRKVAGVLEVEGALLVPDPQAVAALEGDLRRHPAPPGWDPPAGRLCRAPRIHPAAHLHQGPG